MIQGAQKRMIVVKTGDSAVFEEVYFVMRRETSHDRLDMLDEANRIIENCGCNKKRAGSARLGGRIFSVGLFLSGSVIGGAVAVILAAIFS